MLPHKNVILSGVPIASLSVGAERDFVVKVKRDKNIKRGSKPPKKRAKIELHASEI